MKVVEKGLNQPIESDYIVAPDVPEAPKEASNLEAKTKFPQRPIGHEPHGLNKNAPEFKPGAIPMEFVPDYGKGVEFLPPFINGKGMEPDWVQNPLTGEIFFDAPIYQDGYFEGDFIYQEHGKGMPFEQFHEPEWGKGPPMEMPIEFFNGKGFGKGPPIFDLGKGIDGKGFLDGKGAGFKGMPFPEKGFTFPGKGLPGKGFPAPPQKGFPPDFILQPRDFQQNVFEIENRQRLLKETNMKPQNGKKAPKSKAQDGKGAKVQSQKRVLATKAEPETVNLDKVFEGLEMSGSPAFNLAKGYAEMPKNADADQEYARGLEWAEQPKSPKSKNGSSKKDSQRGRAYMPIPKQVTGRVIGHSGITIRRIQAESGAQLHVEEGRVRIQGNDDQRGQAELLLKLLLEPKSKENKKTRPSHFVAVQLTSRMLRRNLEAVQQWFVAQNPLFEKCVVPSKKLHSSLLLTKIDASNEEAARQACKAAGKKIREFLVDQPVKLVCSGVGTFNNGQVLFTKLRTEPKETLQVIHDILTIEFRRLNLPVMEINTQTWLQDQDAPEPFTAHCTFIKVSKGLAHTDDPAEKQALRELRVSPSDIQLWESIFFGAQLCTDFALLAMEGVSRSGYYPCLQSEEFHNKRIIQDQRQHAAPLDHTSNMQVLKLNLEGEKGAGLVLSTCEAGYFVEEVDGDPVQPGLHKGMAILAAGRSLLIGKDVDQVEATFGFELDRGKFNDHLMVVVGDYETLRLQSFQEVKDEVTHLLALFYGGANASEFRYHLRPNAPEYIPKWGSAPNQTRTISTWQMMQNPVQPVSQLSTPIHQKIETALLETSDVGLVLQIAEKPFLSLLNRVQAFERMRLLCGGYLADKWRDKRFGLLLRATNDDLEDACVEKTEVLPCDRLASLTYSLGLLGIRIPSIFANIGHNAGLLGLWRFENEELSQLLEGFSRAQLSDEVLFTDASRIVLHRVLDMPPKLLANCMVAFACSGIVTEHFFHAVGDGILQRTASDPAAFDVASVANLADAFSRAHCRHALLLEVIPTMLPSDKSDIPIESLVPLFTAYVDSRFHQNQVLRTSLGDVLASAKLSVRDWRVIVQSLARAKWPHQPLLDAASAIDLASARPFDIDLIVEGLHILRWKVPTSFVEMLGPHYYKIECPIEGVSGRYSRSLDRGNKRPAWQMKSMRLSFQEKWTITKGTAILATGDTARFPGDCAQWRNAEDEEVKFSIEKMKERNHEE